MTNTYQTACVVCEPGHRKLSFTLSNVYTQDSRIKNKEICKEKFELTYVCTSERYVHILKDVFKTCMIQVLKTYLPACALKQDRLVLATIWYAK